MTAPPLPPERLCASPPNAHRLSLPCLFTTVCEALPNDDDAAFWLALAKLHAGGAHALEAVPLLHRVHNARGRRDPEAALWCVGSGGLCLCVPAASVVLRDAREVSPGGSRPRRSSPR